MTLRIFAISVIFVFTSVAWMILGGTIYYRTDSANRELRGKVGQLWGTKQHQLAPWFNYYIEKTRTRYHKGQPYQQTYTETHQIDPCGSNLKVALKLDQRRKGLLWYSTYKVRFQATYCVENNSGKDRMIDIFFPFPTRQAIYDDFRFTLDGKVLEARMGRGKPARKKSPSRARPAATRRARADTTAHAKGPSKTNKVSSGPRPGVPTVDPSGKVRLKLFLQEGQKISLGISYRSQGLDEWIYRFGHSVKQVRDFNLVLDTDFDRIDFPKGTISPTRKKKTKEGWRLTWSFRNLISGYNVGMTLPKRLNPGPLAARISFFAPVSLLLFFFMLLLITTRRDIQLHPMNYFFLACAFFAFHLLLAYTVDRLPVEAAFAISAVVSIFLVVSYLRLVAGVRFALIEAGAAQFVYLILFSSAFFFQGLTGLAVTILCILTLFVAMQMTGKIDWNARFASPSKKSPAPNTPNNQAPPSTES